VKSKTYRKPVFAGKDVPVIGLDQGKGRMYRGLGTHSCFNWFYDAALLLREGQDVVNVYADEIQHAGVEDTVRFVHTGVYVWCGDKSESFDTPAP
jgi:hypothetical protein